MTKSESSDWMEDDSSSSESSIETRSEWSVGDTSKSSIETRKRSKRTCSEWLDDDTRNRSEETDDQSYSPFPWGLVRSFTLGMFSAILFSVFVLAAANTSDEGGDVSWVFFYSLNAAVPAIFLVYFAYWFPVKVIHLLAMINAVWSIVYLILAALKVGEKKETFQGASVTAMQVQDRATTGVLMQQNAIIVMSSIGFFSSMYHSIMVEHCVKINKDDDDDDDE